MVIVVYIIDPQLPTVSAMTADSTIVTADSTIVTADEV